MVAGSSSCQIVVFTPGELEYILEMGRKRLTEGMDRIADALLVQVTVESQKRPDGGSAVDQGFLHNYHNWRTTKTSKFSRKIESLVEHAVYVNDGTKQRSKENPAPWAPIAAWAERHHLPPFPIWYSINKRGTKANAFAVRAIEWMKQQNLAEYIKESI